MAPPPRTDLSPLPASPAGAGRLPPQGEAGGGPSQRGGRREAGPPSAAAPGSAASGRPRPGPRRSRLTVLLALVVAMLAPTLAWPHAYLVRSSPARRAVLRTPPQRVQLWFNERLEAQFSRVSVHDGAGTAVDLGDVQVGPDDPTRLSVGVPVLPPGTYTVRYRVLSVDGHVVEDRFPFTVRDRP